MEFGDSRMRRITRRLLAGALMVSVAMSLLLLSSGNVRAQLDNSPWQMFRGDPRHTGRSPYDTSHVDGMVKWSFETGAGIESSPAIGSDGTIYIGSHDSKLYAINPDGTEKWHFIAGDPVYNEVWDVWKGILSSPAIGSDGAIYITSLSDKLYAVNPDGTEKWSVPIDVTVDSWSSPTIGLDGTIYVGSSRGSTGPGKVYAINPDGTEKWQFQAESDVFPSPTIGTDGTIYIGCGSSGPLYALNPDGTLKWRFQTGLHIESTAAIGADGIIYVASWDNNVYAINPDGTEKWRFVTLGYGIASSPAIASDGTIYVSANDQNLYALNPDGTKKWNLLLGGGVETTSSPAIGSDGTIYVGVSWESNDKPTFYAINPDGTVKWSTQISGISSSPAIGSNETIYVGSWDRKLHAIGGLPAERVYRISGYIKSKGVPVAGATVTVDGKSTTTGDNGYYKISGLEGNKSYNLMVSATGYGTYNGSVPVGTADNALADISITKAEEEGEGASPSEGMLIIYAIMGVAVIVVGAGVVLVLRKR